VEEVEDIESERGRGTFDCCREPMGTEELNALGRMAFAGTISDNKTVDAGEVEDHEIVKDRRVGTRVANVVSKLKNEAEGREGGFFKKVTIPFLKARQSQRVSVIDISIHT